MTKPEFVWVYAKRLHPKICFLELKVREGFDYKMVQVVFKDLTKIHGVSVGACLKGSFRHEQTTDLFFDIEAVYPATPPFELSRASESVTKVLRYDKLLYALGNPSILKGPAALAKLICGLPSHLISRGFFPLRTPTFSGAGAEGGSAVFKVDYFGRPAVLAQSKQLYKQMVMAAGLGPVFEIAPTFRAEKSDTNRHLTQFTTLDVEMPCDSLDLLIEQALTTISDIFKILGKDLPQPVRKTFLEGRALVGGDIAEDFSTEEIKTIGEELVVITHFPGHLRPFYCKLDGASSFSFDIFYDGIELVSGSLRETNLAVLHDQIQNASIDIRSLTHYLDYFSYGMPPSGGYGLGLERCAMTLLHLDDVRDVVFSVRDKRRLTP